MSNNQQTILLFIIMVVLFLHTTISIGQAEFNLEEQIHNQTQEIIRQHRCSLGYQEDCEVIERGQIVENGDMAE